jgi:hypothetical protein
MLAMDSRYNVDFSLTSIAHMKDSNFCLFAAWIHRYNESGNPFWLLGVDAPIGQKLIFKISKKFEKKLLACISTFYFSLTKFCNKKIFFGAYVKKTIFYGTKLLFT